MVAFSMFSFGEICILMLSNISEIYCIFSKPKLAGSILILIVEKLVRCMVVSKLQQITFY